MRLPFMALSRFLQNHTTRSFSQRSEYSIEKPKTLIYRIITKYILHFLYFCGFVTTRTVALTARRQRTSMRQKGEKPTVALRAWERGITRKRRAPKLRQITGYGADMRQIVQKRGGRIERTHQRREARFGSEVGLLAQVIGSGCFYCGMIRWSTVRKRSGELSRTNRLPDLFRKRRLLAGAPPSDVKPRADRPGGHPRER